MQPPTNPDRAQLAALGAALRLRVATAPVPLRLSDWRRDLEAARAIVDPVLRSRALAALAEAQIAAVEEIAARAREATP